MKPKLRSSGDSPDEQEKRFAEIYVDTAGQIYAYCYRRTVSSTDAEDAMADVFMVAWRRRHDLFSADTSLAWLYAVAYRVVSNHRRTRDRGSALFSRIKGSSPDITVADIASHVVSSIDAQRSARSVLERLDPLDREITLRRYWEELSYAEIGNLVGLKEGSVRSRLHRARRSLAVEDSPRRDYGSKAP